MASVRKKGKVWYFRYTDADGVQRERPGCRDKRQTEAMLADALAETAKIRSGYIDTKDPAYRFHEIRPLTEHIDAWQANLVAQGSTTKHAEHTSNRFRRLVAMMLGAKEALVDHRRLLPNDRGDVARKFNVKEDRRHDRRTVSLDELRKLIETAANGKAIQGMTGPMRALCYRVAVASGMRYSEIATIKPESFDWEAPSVTVDAAYTENGETATLTLPRDLADELAAFVAPLPAGMPIFPLPVNKGAKMLRRDLAIAGIVYEDASGLFLDFHSLRCQTATLADQAGISPRVPQKIMRHSSLELTGRYTRPRAVDIEAAASILPSLKPEGSKPDPLAATGTDGRPISKDFPLILPYSGDAEGRSGTVAGEMTRLDGPTSEMRLSLKKEALHDAGRVWAGLGDQKAPPGFEPGMKVLQTFLPSTQTLWRRWS
jgi:integrase